MIRQIPARLEITIDKTTVTRVMTIELNKYLDIGIPVVEVTSNKSLKFLVVGLITKNLGGHANNSDSGLNAWLNI